MTSPIPLVVKWNKETVNLSVVPEAGVKTLKSELEQATGVPADRMKLMAKSKGLWKGVLKDDENLASIDWASASAKAGAGGLQILLMGSATKLAAPKEKTVFLEDLPPAELAKVQEPSGLVNLGAYAGLDLALLSFDVGSLM
jgi:ubiquitin carboxyl-terminal hydrolase 14